MSDSKVYAVQMIEHNPTVGNKRKKYVLSGIMAFTAGNAIPQTTYIPSQIVPLKNPHQLVKVGDREVELFEFLTGKDPEEPDKYFVHQPRKPSMPVFRRIVADDMKQLRGAVEEQAKRSAQLGKPIAPAPILGAREPNQKAKSTAVKTVEQILAENREPVQEETPSEPKKTEELPAFRDIMDKVASKKTTSKAAKADLEKIKDTLEADDLTYIAENGTRTLKDWAEQEMDERVAAGK